MFALLTGLIIKTRTIPKFLKQKSWITIRHNIIINSWQKANQCLYNLREGNVVRRSSVVWSCLFHSLDKFSCHLIALMKACVHTLLPLRWKWKIFKSDIKLYPSIFIFSVDIFYCYPFSYISTIRVFCVIYLYESLSCFVTRFSCVTLFCYPRIPGNFGLKVLLLDIRVSD